MTQTRQTTNGKRQTHSISRRQKEFLKRRGLLQQFKKWQKEVKQEEEKEDSMDSSENADSLEVTGVM